MVALTDLKCQRPNLRRSSSFLCFPKARFEDVESDAWEAGLGLNILLIADASRWIKSLAYCRCEPDIYTLIFV